MLKNFEGREVAPDVEKLMERYRNALQPNVALEYAALAELLGVPVDSNRFHTVMVKFRRTAMRELNIDFGAVPGYGLRVLLEEERVSYGVRDLTLAGKRLGRSVARIARSDATKLDSIHLQQRDHAIRLGSALVDAQRDAEKKIAIAGKVHFVLAA